MKARTETKAKRTRAPDSSNSPHRRSCPPHSETDDRFRELIDLLPETVFETDERGVLTFVNRNAFSAFGYTEEDFARGLNALDMLAPEDRARADDNMRARLNGEEGRANEYTALRKDGSTFPVLLRSTPIVRDDRNVGLKGIIVDITESKRTEDALREVREELESHVAERTAEFEEANIVLRAEIKEREKAETALRESEERLKRYLESSPDIICVVDLKGILLYINKATEELTGYKRDELVGKSFQDLPLLAPEHRSKPNQWVYGGGTQRPTRRDEFEVVRRDGRRAFVEISTFPMGQGWNAEIIAIGRDVTESRRAQEEKVVMEQQVHLSGRLAAVGQLAAGVAHELNNPLAAIQGFAQLLSSRQDLDESLRSDVETILREAQRASRITANLLSFARKHEPERESICLNEAVEQSVELHAYRMRVNNIEVSTDLAPDLPKTMGDFHQLQQVFVNIITNAEQAMTEAHGSGKLMIRTRRAGDAILVDFADDGPGIPEENMKRVFDPFFTTKEVGKGTGLGLSICYGVVEKHGGRLYATSEVGKGTTFTVELPIVIQ